METNLEKAKRLIKDHALISDINLPEEGFIFKMLELAATPNDYSLIGRDILVHDSLLTRITKIEEDKYYFLDKEGKEWHETKEGFDFIKYRCCGRCDGLSNICFSDMVCDEHNTQGCETCYGPKFIILEK